MEEFMDALKHTLTRRRLLASAACTAAAAAFSSRLPPLRAGAEKRWFKIGACDWCLGRGDPSVFDVAREIGLDGVQVNMGSEGNNLHVRRPEVQKAYLEAARSHGLEIGSLAMGELNNVPLATEPKAAIWLLDTVEAARAMGVKVILMAFFGRGEVLASDKVGMDRLVGLLKEIAPRAEKAGVILGLENYLSAEENLKIIERVGSPALQVYYDVGNSTDKGYDILKEIRLLGRKHICEFHAKDGRHPLGKGRIDFKKVREAMDDIGFSGWIQIEAAAPVGVVPDYKAHLAYLKGIFPIEA
jgi:L-ribulose-5-phosphate 3-epimerase